MTLKSLLRKKCFSDSYFYEVGLSYTIKTKVLAEKKPTQDEIIEAKEVYIQLYFERYIGKLALRF